MSPRNIEMHWRVEQENWVRRRLKTEDELVEKQDASMDPLHFLHVPTYLAEVMDQTHWVGLMRPRRPVFFFLKVG